MAPTLDSVEDRRERQALFTHALKGEKVWRRKTLTNRRDVEKIDKGWNYESRYYEAKNSHWWDHPITMNAQPKILSHQVATADISAAPAESATRKRQSD